MPVSSHNIHLLCCHFAYVTNVMVITQIKIYIYNQLVDKCNVHVLQDENWVLFKCFWQR